MGPTAPRESSRQVVVLWERGPISCFCLNVAPDHIEVLLASDGVVIHRQVFTDDSMASCAKTRPKANRREHCPIDAVGGYLRLMNLSPA
jgi:hypothetical protein